MSHLSARVLCYLLVAVGVAPLSAEDAGGQRNETSQVEAARLENARAAVAASEEYYRLREKAYESFLIDSEGLFQAKTILFRHQRTLLRLENRRDEERELVQEYAELLKDRIARMRKKVAAQLASPEEALLITIEYHNFLANESAFLSH